jgi:NitT/TauT family transport system ATP-binding protein
MNAITSLMPSAPTRLLQIDRLITIANLQVRFGDVVAIEDLSFVVQRGEFISLLGPSGCGKSTQLRAVARLVPSADGCIVLHDTGLRVGFMFQKPLLLPWRTALNNVLLPVEIQLGGSVVSSTDELRARQMLDMVQLGDFVDAFPQQLSGGCSNASHSRAR